jgi:hypothetical protein
MKFSEFYIQLGRLIYSIAKADGKIHPSEMQRFKEVLRKELIHLETTHDAYGTHHAYYAEFELERLIENQADKNEAFTSFILFMEQHPEYFDDTVKNVCLQAVKKNATVHEGIVPEESKMITELKKKFNDLS